MRQFDVFRNPSIRSRSIYPLVVVLQSHLMEASNMTVVAPVIPQDYRSTFTQFSTVVTLADQEVIVLVNELGAVETRLLQRSIGNLTDFEDEIRRAIDRLFTGF